MFKIEEAKQKDASEIRKIIKKSLQKIVSKYYSKEIIDAIYNFYSIDKINSFEEVFIAKEEGHIIGCVAYNNNELKMLYPDPEFKEKAYVAEMLLTFVKNNLKNNGHKTAWGDALKSSRRFIENKGGKITHSFKEILNGKEFEVHRIEFKL